MGKWKGKRKIEKEGKGEKESEEEWDKVWVRERESRVFRVQKEDMSRDFKTQFKLILLERKCSVVAGF